MKTKRNQFRKEEFAIPKEIISVVLLRLIHLLGYELLVRWSNEPGQPQTVDWKLERKDIDVGGE